ncbi:MAG TPA: TIGR03435 family protein, partial [Acidobacteriaceae bacterium]|nr:TIGR03435 family protein [Acidobacteriaceae bacterium]
TFATLLAGLLASAQTTAPLAPMAVDANPSFEVATIKPSAADQRGCGFPGRGREFHAVNCSVVDLIRFAYGVQLKQIVDSPEWLDKLHYDITGVPDAPGQPSIAQRKSMVQKLLADRFKLTFRNEQRELPVYILSVAKTGPKLTAAKPDQAPGGVRMWMTHEGFVLAARNSSLLAFASALQDAVFDRPVVDETGLPGNFDFQVTFAPGGAEFGGMPVPSEMQNSTAPSIFTAVQDLGLRLDAGKHVVRVMAITHVEKPADD